MADLRGTSNFCARYSVVGMLFMVMVAMMLTYQPFYIGGIEDVEQAKRNVYGGVGTFLSIFILSVVYLVLDALRGESREINAIRGRTDTRRGGASGDYEGIPARVEQAHFT
mmetsp:Transcript_14060/g.16100  ORF Transcript_14060/g.16100 Transcript_14060/m.16100 type:complete len:111 (+) Transcript_14060:45-377(+)